MLLLLIAAQAVAAAPVPLAPRTIPRGAALTSLISVDDYPVEAVQNHWEGTVKTRLTVSPEGRVTGCNIVESSGHSVLDAATCRILARRARFDPARDSSGRPVASTYDAQPIVWRLGADQITAPPSVRE